MLSYKVYVLIYSLLIFIISLRILGLSNVASKKYLYTINIKKKGHLWGIVLVILLTLSPKALRVILFGIFQEADYPVYEKDSDFILNAGHISFENLSEDIYYRTFPIYTLINVMLRYSTSLTYYEATLFLNFYCLLLFVLLSILLAERIGSKEFRLPEIMLAAPLFFSNTYLYALWGCSCQ
jgi:hypothetical protein